MRVWSAGALALLPLAATTPSIPVNDPELEAFLLTVDDLPSGWTAQDASGLLESIGDEESAEFQCEVNLAPLLGEINDFPRAAALFTLGPAEDASVALGELIIDVNDEDAVEQFIDAAPQAFEECEAGVSEVSFPDLADGSATFRDTDPDLSTIGAFVAVDDQIVFIVGVGEEEVDIELLEEVTRTAVDQLD
jgi:hypothetical protein